MALVTVTEPAKIMDVVKTGIGLNHVTRDGDNYTIEMALHSARGRFNVTVYAKGEDGEAIESLIHWVTYQYGDDRYQPSVIVDGGGMLVGMVYKLSERVPGFGEPIVTEHFFRFNSCSRA